MKEESEVPLFPNDFSLLLNQKILTSDLEKLQNIFGMPGDLAAKLYKNRLEFFRTDTLTALRKDPTVYLCQSQPCTHESHA